MNKFKVLFQKDLKSPKGQFITLPLDDICELICKYCYTFGKFNRNYRTSKNFIETNVIVFDIDDVQPNKKTLVQLKEELAPYKHVISLTKSHLKMKNNIICERYRIFFFLSNHVKSIDEYKFACNCIEQLFQLKTDRTTKSPARLYYPSISIYSKNESGSDIEIIQPQKVDSTPKPELPIKPFEYLLSPEKIPEILMNWINSSGQSHSAMKKEKFVRILMAQHNLLTHNFIPQSTFAKQINTKIDTISNYIKELITLKQLRIMDNSFSKGRAKKYRAENELRNVIMLSLNNYNVESILPDKIEDGQWDFELMKAAWKFVNDETPDRFIKWASNLPNFFDKEDRQLKPKRAWKSAKKRHNQFFNQ